MTHSDQLYCMNSTLLECSIAEDIPYDNLVIKYNEDSKEWRIVDKTTRRIKFKKIFPTKKTKK